MDLNMHARKECKLCAAGLVPNTERTECGECASLSLSWVSVHKSQLTNSLSSPLSLV